MTGWLDIHRGDAPLIVSVPHAGTRLDPLNSAVLCDPAKAISDTDWHVDRLYAFASRLGATLITTQIARVVIDVNRDPTGQSLYPGQATTALCPLTLFDGTELYRPGQAPDPIEIARRYDNWFRPYHDALDREIARLRAMHPAIVVYDAHSIPSHVPRLFEGRLPAFNIGTNAGTSCHRNLADAVIAHCGTDHMVDGRFRGGWITRRLGAPTRGVHAIQMELAQRTYLAEPDTRWDAGRAAPLQARLDAILTSCIRFAKGQT